MVADSGAEARNQGRRRARIPPDHLTAGDGAPCLERGTGECRLATGPLATNPQTATRRLPRAALKWAQGQRRPAGPARLQGLRSS